jgi:translation initiation factor IF-2
MNVSELSRKLKINTADLFEILPRFGYDIGRRAIKVDDTLAGKIIKDWPRILKNIEFEKRQAEAAISAKTLAGSITKEILLPNFISVRDFSAVLGVPVAEVIKKLMSNGVMATLNQQIDFETSSIIADEFGVTAKKQEGGEAATTLSEDKLAKIMAEGGALSKRPPVIVVMGHVDHGKTKLLDVIRSADVVSGEAGGITQHIGAYQVSHNGKKITFIDTPGHEAFTAMRSRGAKIADIAILVVAADDSIKPQTIEAIKIIRASNLPLVVAINKIDKEGADIERVKKDLADQNLIPEEWGGNTIVVQISAKNNTNIDKLLDVILLVDELEQEKIVADASRAAAGTIIEAHLDKGEGPVATILVQSGTLHVGDQLMINDLHFGKVRSLRDHYNKNVSEAGPSTPVKILGLKHAPKVGDLAEAVSDKAAKEAKKATSYDLQKDQHASGMAQVIETETSAPTLNVSVKADTLGSLEVIIESLEKLSNDKAKVKILQRGLGNITDTDVDKASANGALLFGFHVQALTSATLLAKDRNVEVKLHTVIYHLLEEVEERLAALVTPEISRKELGSFQVAAIFRQEKKSAIIGGKVLSGIITAGTKADLMRKGVLFETIKIDGIKSGKMDIKEAAEGSECGLLIKSSEPILVGDMLNVYKESEK